MAIVRRKINFRWLYKSIFWVISFFVFLLAMLRWGKGAGVLDFYALLIRPFGPGTAQREWIIQGAQVEQNIRLKLLEDDNRRLRKILALKNISSRDRISAAVIARSTNGWWQKLEINKGFNQGIEVGNAVVGPGGLLGIVYNATPTTSRVRLLTGPGSRIGVWIERTKTHGMLEGMGTNRTKLQLLDSQAKVKAGDIVSSSPASTLLPPNLVIGIVQSVNLDALPAPYAIVQLIASPEAIDWVQVLKTDR